eukprot:scaffold123033_cov22-Tisochrysis_lutea.AAC.1
MQKHVACQMHLGHCTDLRLLTQVALHTCGCKYMQHCTIEAANGYYGFHVPSSMTKLRLSPKQYVET